MARFVYYTATSLDGFIADENNSLAWLFEVARDPDDTSWDAFLAGIGAMAMGSTTYEWVLAHDDLLVHPERWHGYYADRPCWVFSHRDLPAIPGVDLRFVKGDVETAYDDMVAAAGHLDEVQLGFCPVLLGAGAPVLPRRITSERLTLRDVHRSGQQVTLVLDVSR
jgi:dihydrofolate reductase